MFYHTTGYFFPHQHMNVNLITFYCNSLNQSNIYSDAFLEKGLMQESFPTRCAGCVKCLSLVKKFLKLRINENNKFPHDKNYFVKSYCICIDLVQKNLSISDDYDGCEWVSQFQQIFDNDFLVNPIFAFVPYGLQWPNFFSDIEKRTEWRLV